MNKIEMEAELLNRMMDYLATLVERETGLGLDYYLNEDDGTVDFWIAGSRDEDFDFSLIDEAIRKF